MYRRFTSDQKESFAGVSGVTITTYTMVSYSGRRSEESARVMDEIASREWGLLLLDEVHVVPAQMFRKVRLRLTHRGPRVHCVLGYVLCGLSARCHFRHWHHGLLACWGSWCAALCKDI